MLKTRIIEPIVALLRQGVSPTALAASVALGGVLGLFPVIGSTTALCLAAALVLRLNHVAIQAVNYIVYPAQILPLVPFMQAGQAMFADDPVLIGLDELRLIFQAGWWAALAELWQLTLYAVAAWAVLAAPLGALVYAVCLPLLRRVRWAGRRGPDRALGPARR